MIIRGLCFSLLQEEQWIYVNDSDLSENLTINKNHWLHNLSFPLISCLDLASRESEVKEGWMVKTNYKTANSVHTSADSVTMDASGALETKCIINLLCFSQRPDVGHYCSDPPPTRPLHILGQQVSLSLAVQSIMLTRHLHAQSCSLEN